MKPHSALGNGFLCELHEGAMKLGLAYLDIVWGTLKLIALCLFFYFFYEDSSRNLPDWWAVTLYVLYIVSVCVIVVSVCVIAVASAIYIYRKRKHYKKFARCYEQFSQDEKTRLIWTHFHDMATTVHISCGDVSKHGSIKSIRAAKIIAAIKMYGQCCEIVNGANPKRCIRFLNRWAESYNIVKLHYALLAILFPFFACAFVLCLICHEILKLTSKDFLKLIKKEDMDFLAPVTIFFLFIVFLYPPMQLIVSILWRIPISWGYIIAVFSYFAFGLFLEWFNYIVFYEKHKQLLALIANANKMLNKKAESA